MIPEIIKEKIEQRYQMPKRNGLQGEVCEMNRDAAQFGFDLADAVGFLNWKDRNGYELYMEGFYRRTRHAEKISAEQLYQTFLTQKEKEK